MAKFAHINGIEDLQEKIEPLYMTRHVCNRAREEFLNNVAEEEK